jgi:hypothetical protein
MPSHHPINCLSISGTLQPGWGGIFTFTIVARSASFQLPTHPKHALSASCILIENTRAKLSPLHGQAFSSSTFAALAGIYAASTTAGVP